MKYYLPCLALCCFIFAGHHGICQEKFRGWPVAGGTKEATHYSSLLQIDTSNVSRLKPAWVYHSGDADTLHHSQIQCNPIVANGILYATSPQLVLLAIDPATGNLKWKFNPFDVASRESKSFVLSLNNNRGVAHWKAGESERIFYSAGSYVFAIDAKTGVLDRSFGSDGKIDLHDGLGRDVSNKYIVSTSPGIIYDDLLIMGTRVSEQHKEAAPGHIRAYDVRTGKQKWIFHTIPYPRERGYETWNDPAAYKKVGGANAWAGFSMDEARGILYAPTGSAAYDFYGGKRPGNNLFANCVIAINARTGKYIWHFQAVHHDVWDRDLSSAPSLVSFVRNGKTVDAIAQPTKSGFVFVLERETGRPIYPIEERPVPTDTEFASEKLSVTQPFPTLPRPFTKQAMSAEDLNELMPDSSLTQLRKAFSVYRTDGPFAPPTLRGTVLFPGLEGGANWGGSSFDPQSALLYINASEVPWLVTIRDYGVAPPPSEKYDDASKRLYTQHCGGCHGDGMKGSGDIPALNPKTSSRKSINKIMDEGRRMMPSFKSLTKTETKAIVNFILGKRSDSSALYHDPMADTAVFRYYNAQSKLTDSRGYPASRPPWGSLCAINLATGEIKWKVPLGQYPELKGIASGTENFGGSIVTRGGLVFIAATRDSKFRAFNKRTGQLLWETDLPAAGYATPATYEVSGKQYVVIACGGGKLGTHSGDAYVAFSLP